MRFGKGAAFVFLAALAACGRPDSAPHKGGAGGRNEGCGAPGAPAELRGNPGPGIAQASIAWSAAPAGGGAPVERYVVYRDGKSFARLGNTLAFGDSGAGGSHAYRVAAVNACGAEGPASEEVTVAALPGALVEAPVAPTSVARAEVNAYKVLDAEGRETGERRWRTIKGLGNCCETYVAADAAGRLYEYGGSNLYVSADEGASWNQVGNVVPAVTAEGALVGAPGGDMLAVNWDPYSGDQLWAHKYVAATDTWYTARTPLHQPFFDRPWVAVVEGPFEVEGLIVPYISFLMSNYAHGDILLMSLDGLHYVTPNTRILASAEAAVPLDLPSDPDRDWIQSIVQTSVYPLDGGYGLRDRASVSSCAHAVLTPAAEWACPQWGVPAPPKAGEAVRVDAGGAIHVTRVQTGGSRIEHRLSLDGGRSWKSATAKLPGKLQIESWDVQVNAGLDQVVIAVHANGIPDGQKPDQDVVLRFTGLRGDFRLKEILLVGDGDQVFGAGLGDGNRFDYTTVALLPGGHVAVSFGDRFHVPPAVAVEMD